MEFDFVAYIGPDPTPAEQLAAIRNDLKSSGSIPWPGLSDLFTCVIGLYGEIEKLRGQVEDQNKIIDLLRGYRSVKNVKTTTIEALRLKEAGDVIERPGASAK